MKTETVKPLHILTVFFCFILNMLDGADVLLVAYAAPLFAQEWNIRPEALGLIFSAGLLGMTAGALVLAPFADVIGRKASILIACFIIGVGMIASSIVLSVEMFILIRFIVGLGIGSMLASVTALASEYAPMHYKNLAVTIATSGYALGAFFTGLVATQIIPEFGWRGLFMFAGVASLLMFFICLFFMPESSEFLLTRQPKRALEKVNKIYRLLGIDALKQLPIQKEISKRNLPSVKSLFQPSLKRQTLALWAAFYCSFLTLYFLTSWIPIISVDAGLTTDNAIYAGATFNLGAFVGLVFIGIISAKVDLLKVIAVFFALATIAMIAFGIVHAPVSLFFTLLFIIGLLVQGGFGGLYAAAARIYPTSFRTTGVGWALGAGRLGAIMGPYLGGIAISMKIDLLGNFILFSIPIGVAGLFMLLLRRFSLSSL